ncbi:DUF6194 family protein [Gilvimarinus sp. SDUM040013]|uniref:DUF6194 family protein n=1 Tax=Gilvimarinus gilvus TaxID=3058038 RepID=A0ABU4RYL8_9GAMM|nr:DUF6194 family protein [Gilvimarinus sp. SDUM040013]MDO3386337.1 DUF6194 family protein [Gilvimarinus sp. SDUM040013]MDX6850005.1 DUF6194 family protein [Gilvimarinus sp. SDUM040013]
MSPSTICEFLLAHYSGLVQLNKWGETSFFYNPGKVLPHGIYFATIKEKDGANDKGSNLDRTEIFRFNFAVAPATFGQHLGPKPKRPAAGEVINTRYDLQQLNTLMPHPVYGWMNWVCVLNPDDACFAALKPLLDESYQLAQKKFAKRCKN